MPTVDAIAAPVATGVETTDMMKALVYLGPRPAGVAVEAQTGHS